MHEMIADLPYDERPRERLILHGAKALSDAELLAILLGSGLPGKNAIHLARDLLGRGSFNELGKKDPRVLSRINGLGPAKATRIAAAHELARRAAGDTPTDAPAPCDPDLLGRRLVARFARERQERLGAALLDSRHRLLLDREIYIGTVNHACISQRDIICLALDLNAVNAILYHNHPSGDPTPSAHDVDFTKESYASLKAIEVTLVDHLVIGANRYFSMKREELFG